MAKKHLLHIPQVKELCNLFGRERRKLTILELGALRANLSVEFDWHSCNEVTIATLI